MCAYCTGHLCEIHVLTVRLTFFCFFLLYDLWEMKLESSGVVTASSYYQKAQGSEVLDFFLSKDKLKILGIFASFQWTTFLYPHTFLKYSYKVFRSLNHRFQISNFLKVFIPFLTPFTFHVTRKPCHLLNKFLIFCFHFHMKDLDMFAGFNLHFTSLNKAVSHSD